MALKVKLSIKNETLFVDLDGELDFHTSKIVKDKLVDLMYKYEIINTVFILNNLTFMDSSGIGVIIGRYNHLKRCNGNLYLSNMNENIKKIVHLSGLNKICSIIDDYRDINVEKVG